MRNHHGKSVPVFVCVCVCVQETFEICYDVICQDVTGAYFHSMLMT